MLPDAPPAAPNLGPAEPPVLGTPAEPEHTRLEISVTALQSRLGPSGRLGRILQYAGRLLRDGWLIVGGVLVLLLALEFTYRAQAGVRRAVLSNNLSEALFPASAPDWVDAYLREELATYDLNWRPYVYFRRAPFAGRYINIDSTGKRVTFPAASPDRPIVWLFGGSTMFGTFQRDSQTIASVLAAQLRDRGDSSQVVNWGETGYVFTQEVIELLLQLRAGARPDVVVFYDGINDVVAAIQHRAGVPQNEQQRARDFAFGRTVFSWNRDLAADGRALGALARVAMTRSQLFARLVNLRAESAPLREPSAVTREVVRTYVETVRLVEAAAERYGFEPIYLWQPTLHASDKALSPEESELMDRVEASPFHSLVRQVHVNIAAAIDSAMTGVADSRFLNLARVFAGNPEPIFVDIVGHTVEAASPLIVDRLAPLVAAALATPRARGPARSAGSSLP